MYSIADVQLGTRVLEVTANDVDLKPDLTYDFTASGNPNSSFSIDRYSGRIAVARNLDYETSHQYILEVQASDTVHNVTARVIVKVQDKNDNPPEFSQQSYQVISLTFDILRTINVSTQIQICKLLICQNLNPQTL